MPIAITCPGCLKRFQVSEKFAGKSGPCPNCKQIIKIPEKEEEVVVHAPEAFATGGRDTSGKLTLKPIAREETKFNPLVTAGIVGTIIVILAGTWFGGHFKLFNNLWVIGFGLLLVSPFSAVASYTFLRDDELEPYRGKSLYLRALICGCAYALLWLVFYFAAPKILDPENPQLWSWFILMPPLLIGGTVAAWATLDLEWGNAFFHYSFYLLVTILLRWFAGLGWIWNRS